MPQTMLTVRGNLGANPTTCQRSTMEDGAILPVQTPGGWSTRTAA